MIWHRPHTYPSVCHLLHSPQLSCNSQQPKLTPSRNHQRRFSICCLLMVPSRSQIRFPCQYHCLQRGYSLRLRRVKVRMYLRGSFSTSYFPTQCVNNMKRSSTIIERTTSKPLLSKKSPTATISDLVILVESG